RGRDGGVLVGGEDDQREDDGTDGGEDSDDDGRGSASEISTIAKEVDKVNQIINNCIDALKLDSAAVAAAAAAATSATTTNNPTSPPPCISPLARGLIPLSAGITEACQILASPKIPPPPPLPLVLPLSERPGISGGGFLSPPYRDPPPATAIRPLQRQLSADAAVVVLNSMKNRCSTSSGGSIKSTRVFSLDVPEPRSPDSCKYPEKASSVGCGEPMERLPLVGGQGGAGCGGNSVGGGGGGVVTGMGGQHLEVHPDYHCSEHRHSFPALYYEGATDSPSQKASFLKPLTRTKRDAASYSQLSPRHHNYSGYSSSPEYSSESTLRIWERFRPYKKGPREEATYIAAGHALRKKKHMVLKVPPEDKLM
ncbi:hypothetical protein AAFF_G00295560, partial [Aldrovandia affinis]